MLRSLPAISLDRCWPAPISRRTQFSGAYLYQTRFEKTDLSAAKGLTKEQLQIACGDATTKLPADIGGSSKLAVRCALSFRAQQKIRFIIRMIVSGAGPE